MALASSPSLGVGVRVGPTASWPSLIETLLALAAIAALLQPFERLSANDTGRDRRFADTAISVGGLPAQLNAPWGIAVLSTSPLTLAVSEEVDNAVLRVNLP